MTRVRDGEPLTAMMIEELDVMWWSPNGTPYWSDDDIRKGASRYACIKHTSLLAKLNVLDAEDDKAKEYNQQEHGKVHPFALMLPNAGALVAIPEGMITAKVVNELSNYATWPPPLCWHIQHQRNNSTHQIMGLIDWSAKWKALNGMIAAKRVHLLRSWCTRFFRHFKGWTNSPMASVSVRHAKTQKKLEITSSGAVTI